MTMRGTASTRPSETTPVLARWRTLVTAIGDGADRVIASLSRWRPAPVTRYGCSLALVLLSTLLRLAMPLPPKGLPYLLYVPAVFVASLMFGLGAGLAATALAAILADWLFLGVAGSPRLGFGQQATTVLFVLFCGFISVVCDAVRRGASRREAELSRYRALQIEADASALALRGLNETLELRVRERTAELESAQDALRHAHKMEALGQLTGGIAHDFNNLLAAISGNLELLRARVAQGRLDAIERHLMAAQGATTRAAALTDRLLTFSRRQSLAPQPTNVNRLVAGMEEIIGRAVGPGVAVRMTLAADLWPTLVDPNQLENALLNLCINARDAMPHGGRLTIETANVAAGSAGVALAGDHVLLRVGDTGVGMPREVAARAFEPFFTTKPIGQGTGLGLSMIYGFALQSGGRVDIESSLGEGASISLRLPRHPGEAPAVSADLAIAKAEPVGKGGTVLVIDDEASVRALVVEALRGAGYETLEARDGPSGLALLRSREGIDLLLTDLGLPGGMNGRRVAAAARLHRPGLKVAYITGYAEIAPLEDGESEPDTPVLAKPFNLETLQARVRDLIEATGPAGVPG
jgi:signal transduction histidine kinase/ActR/RegA family two-component response regulator